MGGMAKYAVVTLVVGAGAFVLGPMLWPPGADLPHPPAGLMPAYLALAVVEGLAFGFAAAFLLFAWPAVRAMATGSLAFRRALYVSVAWLMGNWWMHDGLHMNVGLDMGRLVYIEYAFHVTLLACGLVLAVAIIGNVRRATP